MQDTPNKAPEADLPFAALGLSDDLAGAASACGFDSPTPVQAEAIPAVLAGRDVLATAQTGSGKTLAYVLPLLQQLESAWLKAQAKAAAPPPGRRPTRVLVLVPTRELALQIGESLHELAPHLQAPLRWGCVFGGVSINPQMMGLRGGADIVVATPGRLLDLIEHNALSLAGVRTLVLDEADRLLDKGFEDELQRVLALLPAKRQGLMFSATFAPAVEALAQQLLHDAARIDVRAEAVSLPDIHQRAIQVDAAQRTPLLRHLIAQEGWSRVLVFVATRYACELVAHKLQKAGIRAAAFHADASQGARREVLAAFKAGELQVVVATDLLPLSDWLMTRQADRYFLRWRPQAIETRSLGVFTLAHVVPPAVMHYLAEDNTVIVHHLMASVSGISQYRDHNVLDELVRRSLALVIDRNLLANADRYGTPQYGSHLERYLVDALRHLAGSNPGWQANREKSRVWFGPDGLFLAWPSAAEDIQKLLDTTQLPGIPKAPETIMEVLLLARVFEPTPSGSPTWLIQPPGAKARIEAVKLSSTAILFVGHDPFPPLLAESLTGTPRNNSPSVPVASQSQPDGPSGTQLSLIPGNPEPEQTQQAASNGPAAPAETALLSTAPPSTVASTSNGQTAEQAPIDLQAPLRLNPVVRDALTEVVNTLNTGAGPAQCCTVAFGVFVPLHEFERRGIQPSMALRALSDVHMLVRAQGKGPPTTSRDFNGTPTVGLTIDPRFFSGVDMAAFAVPAAQGG